MRALLGPSLHDIVNPSWEHGETWHDFLVKQHVLFGSAPGIRWYCSSNHHYIVYHGRVIQTFGYQGERVFLALQHKRTRRALFRAIRQLHTTVWLMQHTK